MTPNHMTVRTFTVTGVDARPAMIEVAVSQSLPAFAIVGLGDRIERETRERVTAAIVNCGYEMPRGRVVVNVAPAHVRRVGGGYGLPIAYAILAATDQVRADPLRAWGLWGDIELTGELRGARGSVAVAQAAARIGLDGLVVAADNEATARLAPGIAVHGARTLRDVARLLGGRPHADARELEQPDLADIRGNAAAIRAATVAAAGGHHLLLTGPAGAGRTMLARRIPGILPPLGIADALDVARIHDIAGNVHGRRLPTARPFRAPHHSISTSGLIGSGAVPAPGEISLAHRGVVYLDEVDQFSRSAMAALTGAVEDREVLMHRDERCTVLPCDVLLVASVGDCPCGRGSGTCGCGPSDLQRWRRGVLERAGDVLQIAAALCTRRAPRSSPRPRRRRRSTQGCSSRSHANARPNAPPRPVSRSTAAYRCRCAPTTWRASTRALSRASISQHATVHCASRGRSRTSPTAAPSPTSTCRKQSR